MGALLGEERGCGGVKAAEVMVAFVGEDGGGEGGVGIRGKGVFGDRGDVGIGWAEGRGAGVVDLGEGD